MRPARGGGVQFWCAVVMAIAVTVGAGSARAATESGRLVRSGPVSLYVEVRGSGDGPPLFMVNGGPGFAHDYVHCSDAWDTIAKHRRVVFYDQRGTGRSSRLKAGVTCTLADQIADLDAVRASLGVEKMDLLGHSWGGYLVMAYTARHPEHVARLMIVDSAAPRFSDTEFIFKYVFPAEIERQQALQFAEAMGDSMAMQEDIHEYLQLLFADPANRDRFMAKADQYRYEPGVNQKVNADLANFDLNPELKKFRCPTLVITGRWDMNVAPSTAWRIHQAIPGSRFEVFERSGHIPYFEEPEKFVSVIEAFLAR